MHFCYKYICCNWRRDKLERIRYESLNSKLSNKIFQIGVKKVVTFLETDPHQSSYQLSNAAVEYRMKPRDVIYYYCNAFHLAGSIRERSSVTVATWLYDNHKQGWSELTKLCRCSTTNFMKGVTVWRVYITPTLILSAVVKGNITTACKRKLETSTSLGNCTNYV